MLKQRACTYYYCMLIMNTNTWNKKWALLLGLKQEGFSSSKKLKRLRDISLKV